MNDALKEMFKKVQDEKFDKWEAVDTDTISEAELINNAHNGHSQPQQATQNVQASNVQQQTTVTQTTTINQQPGTINLGNMIDEETAVEFMDIAGSSLSMLAVRITTKQKVKRSQFCASEKEKKTLEPLMKTALAQANIKITNPFEALFYGFVFVYGSKVGVTIAEQYLDGSEDRPQRISEPTTGERRRGRPRKS